MNMILSFFFMLAALFSPMQGEVISNKLDVYDSPDSCVVIGTLNHGDKVGVVDENEQFYKIVYDSEYGDGYGWVLSCYVLESGNYGIVTFPDFNGSVKRDIKAFELNEGYQQTSIILTKDTRVKILSGYDNKKEFTEVAFVHEGRVVVYYVHTEDIAPDGVNPNIIIAISLITTALGIIFILMGVKFTKKKRKEGNTASLSQKL